jgi:flavin reductase (DIM6/NTAB) family NADH-FMN oxidoreductase RutF
MKEATIKEAFNKFKPESCVFVISVDGNGKPNGMVAGWHMKSSSEPPCFSVCISKKGNTQRLIRESREFVVAVPNKELEDEVMFFGSNHGYDVDKFKETRIDTIPAKAIKPPLLLKATINLECRLINEAESGDHLIFTGQIVAAHMNPEKKILFNMKTVDGKRVFEEM